jgi:glucose-6-phosphate 1-dehydrogenase
VTPLALQLALPPSSFSQVSHMIKNHNYSETTINRLVIEKPFGKDTDDCKKMMDSIAQDWKEEEVYRIDHYLGMDIPVSAFLPSITY